MVKNKKYIYLPFFLLALLLIVIDACKKEGSTPKNPYDDVIYDDSTLRDIALDSNSFAGIHKNILSLKCANPGCHDGNFEPDFRTIQSSYSTLVYHPVKKKLAPWQHRVVPNDTAKSWFWQRLNHSIIISGTDTSQGQMPLYSSALSQQELKNISNWILNGAKDIFNQTPSYPNSEPTISGFLAFNSNYSQRRDTIRENNVFYHPFLVNAASTINILVFVEDDSTSIANLTNNKIKLSLSADDFSNATVINGVYSAITSQISVWVFTINTSAYQINDHIYMRHYTNDRDHLTDTEMPRTDMLQPYKTLWSFKIIP